jgi:hypothetical protein
LWLDGTAVTDEGVKTLQQALPKCAIRHWDRWSRDEQRGLPAKGTRR